MINVRPMRDEDAIPLFELFTQKVRLYLRDNIPKPYTMEDAKTFVFFAKGQCSSGRTFAIEYEGEFAGIVSLDYGEYEYCKNAQVGFWLGEKFWGKGMAAQAIGFVTNFAFEKREIKRVYAAIISENIQSARALLKAGFHHEARHACAIFKNGKFYDEDIYAMFN